MPTRMTMVSRTSMFFLSPRNSWMVRNVFIVSE